MSKVANATCTVCHHIKPRTEMALRNFREHSGESLGVSTNLKKNNPIRISGRQYTRIRKKWICHGCWLGRPNYLLTIIATVLVNPFFVPRYKKMSSLLSVLYIITLGGFFLGWLFTSLQAIFGSLENAEGLPNSRLF
jgi:hypothetical protein